VRDVSAVLACSILDRAERKGSLRRSQVRSRPNARIFGACERKWLLEMGASLDLPDSLRQGFSLREKVPKIIRKRRAEFHHLAGRRMLKANRCRMKRV